jgi:ATPase family AAA domain-containing protein 1
MATGLYIAKNFLSSLSTTLADPDREKHEQARLQAKEHLERLRRGQKTKEGAGGERSDDSSVSRRGPRVEELKLNEYENLIALEMIAPEDIPVGFDGKAIPLWSSRLMADKMGRYWGLGRHHRGS